MKLYLKYLGWNIYMLSGEHPAYKAVKPNSRRAPEYADSLEDIKAKIRLLGR